MTPAEALERARAAAGGHEVRIGGGTGVVRDFLRAGLVDHLDVSITPIVLGSGVLVSEASSHYGCSKCPAGSRA